MTAAERATLTYSRTQMLVSLLVAVPLLLTGWALVRLGVGYGVLMLIPVFGGVVAMFLIGYDMHSAAAAAVQTRHHAERLAIVADIDRRQQVTVDERQQLFRKVALWWAAGNPTAYRQTRDEFSIGQDTWHELRQMAVDAGLAHWQDGPTGRALVWTAPGSQTVKLTAGAA